MLPEKLKTKYFKDFNEGLKDLEIEDKPFQDSDILIFLRPYYWHIHGEGGFQDIYNASVQLLKVIDSQKSSIDEMTHETLTTFLVAYINNGSYAGSLTGIIASLTITLEYLSSGSGQNDKKEIERYIKILEELINAQYNCYYSLREIGVHYTASIYKLAITLAPEYQEFILHSLDGFEGNTDVINFYENFIQQLDKNKNDRLFNKASEYLAKVRPG